MGLWGGAGSGAEVLVSSMEAPSLGLSLGASVPQALQAMASGVTLLPSLSDPQGLLPHLLQGPCSA